MKLSGNTYILAGMLYSMVNVDCSMLFIME